ncbi:NAD(P)-dependent oxidoreductase [Pseudomonas aeruginosa]|uniref:NAD(P)-dependent oxidoreductase n=1 Tax=Pseudomonas aeruginosa TaxID=287 RepID=UPI000941231A|nr:NAD(P)-dependent oxidoreductase [Pseudomonas aeruginosa]
MCFPDAYIGKRIAALCLCAGMQVSVYDPYAEITEQGIEKVRFEELLASSDYVVAAAYATPETIEMFNARAFGQMRKDSFFINIARGILVDEEALYHALTRGQIQGAGLDVGRGLDEQPNPKIAVLANVIATPHVAGLTPEASDYQAMECVAQVQDLLAGRVPALALNPEHASRLRSFHHA